MDEQVIICDENGDKVGITFKRRAKQLVIKNRAYWVDGKHSAICLITPDKKEEKEVERSMPNNQAYEIYEAEDVSEAYDKDKLYRLAAKRVAEKRRIKRYILIYAVACVIGTLLINAWWYEDFLIGFILGCMLIPGILIVHRIAVYFKPYFIGINFLSFVNRSDSDRVELEYRRLKKIEPDKITKIYKR